MTSALSSSRCMTAPSSMPSFRAERQRVALPRGPAMPALLHTLRYVVSPLRFAEACARRYGDCFTVRVLGQPPTVIFSDPDATKDIFMSDFEVVRGGEANAEFMVPILGRRSIMVLDGPAISGSGVSCCPRSTEHACRP